MQKVRWSQTLLRGGEQERITLGSLATHTNVHTLPIAAQVLVILNHVPKMDKEGERIVNRVSTHSTSALSDPQLYFGLLVLARLSGRMGQHIAESEADSGIWCALPF
jgi:hypothetical protein